MARSELWELLLKGWVEKKLPELKFLQPIIIINKKVIVVNHNWGCIWIYHPLSDPFSYLSMSWSQRIMINDVLYVHLHPQNMVNKIALFYMIKCFLNHITLILVFYLKWYYVDIKVNDILTTQKRLNLKFKYYPEYWKVW